MWPFEFGETVVVLRARRVEDPYSGESRLDWDDPLEFPMEHCAVDARAVGEAAEPADNPIRDPIITGRRVFGPHGWDVTPEDRMRVRGEVWDVHGEPFDPVSPFSGWAPGTQVDLKRVEG